MRARAGFILGLALAWLCLIVIGDLAASRLPLHLLGDNPENAIVTQPGVLDHFFTWDGAWYERIAGQGYSWTAGTPGMQTIAFFPLWPLVLQSLHWLVPGRAAVIVLCLGLALVSIWRLHVLATKQLGKADARIATALYTLYPASIFLLHDYPVGLLNCLTICSLEALLAKRVLRAAVLSGIATAAAPLAVAMPLTLSLVLTARLLTRHDDRPGAADIARDALIITLAFGGLILFGIWQALQFGDPLAFVHAQNGWGVNPPASVRIVKTVLQLTILPGFLQAALALTTAWSKLQSHDLNEMQHQLQGALNVAALSLALLALIGVRRNLDRALLVQGLIVIALYAWFMGSAITGWATMRLIYVAPGIFIGAAIILRGRPRLASCVVGLFGVLVLAEEFMMSAGYRVI